MPSHRIAVIGAGIGGLVAALDLAQQGQEVVVFERAATPGGKLREACLGGQRLDVGPTVLTLRAVFADIFARAGARLEDHLTLHPADILARHAWSAEERLDLFAERERTIEAIGAFAGPADAAGYRRFMVDAARLYAALDDSFLRADRPSFLGVLRGAGRGGLRALAGISPFRTLWQALETYFRDPRLRQLFGRYATYCGASPFLAPATLALIAHVEQEGVWLVEGGMYRLATALAGLAAARGAVIRYGSEVTSIDLAGGRVAGVTLASGEVVAANAVIVNADSRALATGLFGSAAKAALPCRYARAPASLSALTWAMLASARGFPLLRHTVFFARDYAAEFEAILARGELPGEPTVYVCAEDRGADEAPPPAGAERLFLIVNAPAARAGRPLTDSEIERCETEAFSLLERAGLTLERRQGAMRRTTPAEFASLFPASEGALYGRALNGWRAAFRRPTAPTRVPGLYLAGGSVHPGPGVPMAALSGQLAAARVLADLASTSRSRQVAMPGGISMR